MRRIFLSMGVLAALCVTSLAGGDRELQRYAEEFRKLPAMIAAIGKAKKVVLYEGLPHQTWERKLLEQELKTKKTVKLHGFPFYKEPLSLKVGDAKKLTALFSRAGSLAPYAGPKRCGGFHPDYCVEWQVGKQVYRALVCFGCQEVKFHGPKTSVYCDIDRGLSELKKILKPYRKNRPQTK